MPFQGGQKRGSRIFEEKPLVTFQENRTYGHGWNLKRVNTLIDVQRGRPDRSILLPKCVRLSPSHEDCHWIERRWKRTDRQIYSNQIQKKTESIEVSLNKFSKIRNLRCLSNNVSPRDFFTCTCVCICMYVYIYIDTYTYIAPPFQSIVIVKFILQAWSPGSLPSGTLHHLGVKKSSQHLSSKSHLRTLQCFILVF